MSETMGLALLAGTVVVILLQVAVLPPGLEPDAPGPTLEVQPLL